MFPSVSDKENLGGPIDPPMGSDPTDFFLPDKVQICILRRSNLLLSVSTVDKSKMEISQNFVAFSECTNFVETRLAAMQ